MTSTRTQPLTAESTSRLVELPSGTMHYHDAGSGHPVILIHGSGAGASGWSNFSPNIAALAEEFRVIAVDVIGWGESSAPRDGEYNGPVQIIELMDALGLEKAGLVGNSMGGVIAIAAAARHPERVSHLITMGPGVFTDIPPLFGPGGGPSEGLKVLFEAYADPSVETMKKLTSIMAYDSEMTTDELARGRSEAARAHPEHLANALAGFRDGSIIGYGASPAEAARITAPALLVHGRDDRVMHYENTLRLLAVVPDSRAVLLNRCGHWVQLEHADEFNRLVADFVRTA